MKVLELFSGTCSASKVCREHGHETLSLDIDGRHAPDLQIDVLEFDETLWPRDHFQLIWASKGNVSAILQLAHVLGWRGRPRRGWATN